MLVVRLHIGSGPIAIPGWTNVDIVAYPGVDAAFDVREPWPFTGVELIFAEHFIEHLSLSEGLTFLSQCRRALRTEGVLRLSTPNLDWVWLTHYKQPEQMSEDEQLLGCLEINRAFHGWGHQFLYNRRTIELALCSAGFADIATRTYGDSPIDELRNMERHERHQDLPGAPSVIVIEASGAISPTDTFRLAAEAYIRDFSAR